MAHDLLIENGKASMFYVQDVPWHKLGTRLQQPPPTAAAAIRAANLDWQVQKVPLYGAAGTRLVCVPDTYAVVRADKWGNEDCPVFGVVGGTYTPLQNLEAFQFFDPVIQSGAAVYETAALGAGARVWVQARIRGENKIAPGDQISKYVLLSNSHDGRSSVELKFTPVRVVCRNTLTLALSGGRTIRVPHRADIQRRLQVAATDLGLHGYSVTRHVTGDNAAVQTAELQRLLSEGFATLEDVFRKMVARTLTATEWTQYFAECFPIRSNLSLSGRRESLRRGAGRRTSDGTGKPTTRSRFVVRCGPRTTACRSMWTTAAEVSAAEAKALQSATCIRFGLGKHRTSKREPIGALLN